MFSVTAVPADFAKQRIVVVGDLMLDRYLWGKVERISPEAPIPVLHLQRETEVLGGAANVAHNLVGLGAQVAIAGVVGSDDAGTNLKQALTVAQIDQLAVPTLTDRPTTCKTRVMGHRQQMLRIDHENCRPLSSFAEAQLRDACVAALPTTDALLLSDYAKGVLSESLCATLIEQARAHGVPVLVDPKGRDFARYRGATLITPNRTELAQALGLAASDLPALLEAGAKARIHWALDWLVVTLGELGLALIGDHGITQLPAQAREVFDVSGAGDTVIAVLTVALSAGLSVADGAQLANLGAGVVVSRVGTAPLTHAELQTALTGETAHPPTKLYTLAQIQRQVAQWRAHGERIVFTNGCFDLLHAGHARYLAQARRYGQRLVVGLNSDRSVRTLKGASRPLMPEHDRAELLAALSAVDAVVLFDDDTPLELICALRPEVLAKGADYRPDQVVGAAEVTSWGGQLVLLPILEHRSSSALIARLADLD